MFFFNFNKPDIKLKRVAEHLHSQLDNYFQNVQYQFDAFKKDTGLVELENDDDQVFQLSKRQFDATNYSSQLLAYSRFRLDARILLEELSEEKPDYNRVKFLAEELKDILYVRVYSFNGENEFCEQFWLSGATLLTDLACSLDLLETLVYLIGSVFFAPFYWVNPQIDPIFPEFFMASLNLFCCSLERVINSIIFPIALLRSKYETDSWNVFKGELIRSLDSIIALSTTLASKVGTIEPQGLFMTIN